MEDISYDIGWILYSINKETNLFDSSKKLYKFKRETVKYEKYNTELTFKSAITKVLKMCEWFADRKYYLIKDMLIDSYKNNLDYFYIFGVMICYYNMEKKDIDILVEKLSEVKDNHGIPISSLLLFFLNSDQALWEIKFEDLAKKPVCNLNSGYYYISKVQKEPLKTKIKDFFDIDIKSAEDLKIDNLFAHFTQRYEFAMKRKQEYPKDRDISNILNEEDKEEFKLMKSQEVYANYDGLNYNSMIPLKHSINMRRDNKILIKYFRDFAHLNGLETNEYIFGLLYQTILTCRNYVLIKEVTTYFYKNNKELIYRSIIDRIRLNSRMYKTIIKTIEKCVRNEFTDKDKIKQELINANKQLLGRFKNYIKKYKLVDCMGIDVAYLVCKTSTYLSYSDILTYMINTNIDLKIESPKSLFNKILIDLIEENRHMRWESAIKNIKDYINWEVVFDTVTTKDGTLSITYLNRLYEFFKQDEKNNIKILKDMKRCFYRFFREDTLSRCQF